jgi:hypothetical protein
LLTSAHARHTKDQEAVTFELSRLPFSASPKALPGLTMLWHWCCLAKRLLVKEELSRPSYSRGKVADVEH